MQFDSTSASQAASKHRIAYTYENQSGKNGKTLIETEFRMRVT